MGLRPLLLGFTLLSAISFEYLGTGMFRVGPGGASTTIMPFASAPDAIMGVYIVYRRPKAFLETALSFRASYPETKFYILCDVGCYDYRAVAAGFHAAFIGPLELTVKNGRLFLNPVEALRYFAQLREIFAEAHEPFFVVLEDDVRILKRVDVNALHADVNGAVGFTNLQPSAEAWILARNPVPRRGYGGALHAGGMGGNVLRTSFWRTVFASSTLVADVTSLIEETKANGIDQLFSCLAYAYNGTVGFFDGYGAGWSPETGKRMWNERLEILHDYKIFYSIEPTAADITALGPGWDTPLM